MSSWPKSSHSYHLKPTQPLPHLVEHLIVPSIASWASDLQRRLREARRDAASMPFQNTQPMMIACSLSDKSNIMLPFYQIQESASCSVDSDSYNLRQ